MRKMLPKKVSPKSGARDRTAARIVCHRRVRRSPLALYNPPVEVERSPGFDPKRPVASAAAVLRAVLLAPKSFYLNFPAEGPLREPILFVLLVSAVSAVLRLLLVLIFSTEGAVEAGIAVLETIAYVALERFTAMVNVAGDVPVDGSAEDTRTLRAA